MRPQKRWLRRAKICLCLAAAVLFGCTAATRHPPAAAPERRGRVQEEAAGDRRRLLFRVAYQGPGGSGSLRLALLDTGSAAYQARASDAFGRGLWSLELAGLRVTFVDHRQRLFCVTEEDLRLPELALGSLSLDRLPALLDGEIPATPRGAGDDPGDFVDVEGRRWTARWQNGVLEAWTLWQGDRPLLWWQRREEGGMLSHRDGAQLRWRRSVTEPLGEAPPPLTLPGDYLAADCADLSALPADAG